MIKHFKLLIRPRFFNLLFIVLMIVLLGVLFLLFRRYIVQETFTFKIVDSGLVNTKHSVYLPLHVGDKEINDFGTVTGEITKVESYATTSEERDIYIEVKMKTVFNPKNKTYTYKGKRVVYGENFVFNFPEARFNTLSLGLSKTLNQNTKRGVRRVKVQLKAYYEDFSDTFGVPEYLANALTVGDVIRSTNGEELVKIEAVTIQPAIRVVSSYGTLLKGNDPVLKDVFMVLSIKTYEQNGDVLIFNRKPLRVGEVVPLLIKGKVSAWPTITEIL